MESGELIMVIIVVMVLLIAALLGFGALRSQGIDSAQRELTSLRAIDLAIHASSTPEMRCSFAVEEGELCIDIYRMNALIDLIDREDADIYNYFRSKFGQSTIKVSQIYPVEKEWLIYDVRPTNPTSETPLRIPVYLYNATTRTNHFGVMEVVRYG